MSSAIRSVILFTAFAISMLQAFEVGIPDAERKAVIASHELVMKIHREDDVDLIPSAITSRGMDLLKWMPRNGWGISITEYAPLGLLIKDRLNHIGVWYGWVLNGKSTSLALVYIQADNGWKLDDVFFHEIDGVVYDTGLNDVRESPKAWAIKMKRTNTTMNDVIIYMQNAARVISVIKYVM